LIPDVKALKAIAVRIDSRRNLRDGAVTSRCSARVGKTIKTRRGARMTNNGVSSGSEMRCSS
jgi:hypothetical protein